MFISRSQLLNFRIRPVYVVMHQQLRAGLFIDLWALQLVNWKPNANRIRARAHTNRGSSRITSG